MSLEYPDQWFSTDRERSDLPLPAHVWQYRKTILVVTTGVGVGVGVHWPLVHGGLASCETPYRAQDSSAQQRTIQPKVSTVPSRRN